METLRALVGVAQVDAVTWQRRLDALNALPHQDYLGPRGTVRFLKTAAGVSLCGYYWPAAGTPKAQIVVAHGHASYLCFEFLKRTPVRLLFVGCV